MARATSSKGGKRQPPKVRGAKPAATGRATTGKAGATARDIEAVAAGTQEFAPLDSDDTPLFGADTPEATSAASTEFGAATDDQANTRENAAGAESQNATGGQASGNGRRTARVSLNDVLDAVPWEEWRDKVNAGLGATLAIAGSWIAERGRKMAEDAAKRANQSES